MSRWLPPSQLRGRKKVVYARAIGVLAVGTLSAVVSQGSAAPSTPPWLNANKPIQARVSSLMGAMTLPEKVGQMDQQLVDDVTGPSNGCGSQGWADLNTTCLKTVLVDNNAGSLLAGGTDNPPDTTGQNGTGN